ncbi:hypothetical protein SY83_13365 [Paenibacillus swuensis]|uniref:CBM6 domain-containing protein n=1 Tax=Paenibacillus swuensis TaxID=1178515 RepID=A0A172TJS6_9BACL|nr:hypothetical protein [Paenibacillus swuensis]ANE47087.1 hypothetical protein SY83_13365 [Paenibacillus swuensis]
MTRNGIISQKSIATGLALLLLCITLLTGMPGIETVHAASTTIEAEQLDVTVSVGRSNTDIADSLSSGGYLNTTNLNGVDKYVEYKVPVASPGSYTIDLLVRKMKTTGAFQLSIDGVNQGNPVDSYASSTSYETFHLENVTFATAGDKMFRLTIVGKNAAATNYNTGLDAIVLTLIPPISQNFETGTISDLTNPSGANHWTLSGNPNDGSSIITDSSKANSKVLRIFRTNGGTTNLTWHATDTSAKLALDNTVSGKAEVSFNIRQTANGGRKVTRIVDSSGHVAATLYFNNKFGEDINKVYLNRNESYNDSQNAEVNVGVLVPSSYTSNQWIKTTFELDYGAKTYDVTIRDTLTNAVIDQQTDIDFYDPNASNVSAVEFGMYAASYGSMFADDIYVASLGTGGVPSADITTSEVLRLTLQGGQNDQYGQYQPAIPYMDDPIQSNQDLLDENAAEPQYIHNSVVYDNYGGIRTGGTIDTPGGYFRTKMVDGKLWLVTPDGNRYFYKAMTTAMPYSYVPISKTDNIPATWNTAGELKPAYVTEGNLDRYSPVIANYIRRYGETNWESQWYTNTYNRLKSWGFNAIGDWSARSVMKFQTLAPGMPYVRTIRLGDSPVPKIGSSMPQQIPDPFDPLLPQWIKNVIDGYIAENPGQVTDPNLIAYVVGNEMLIDGWADSKPYLVIADILSAPAARLAKQDMVDWLKNRYNDNFTAFNAEWQIANVASFDDVLNTRIYGFDPDIKSATAKGDMKAYIQRFANQLFGVVTDAIKDKDPNHMIWGSRFVVWPEDFVVESAAQYFDVLAFDMYSYSTYRDRFDHFRNLIEATHPDVGFIISEFGMEDMSLPFYITATTYNDMRLFAPLETKEKLGATYAGFVESLADAPYFVGFSYFKYYPTDGMQTSLIQVSDRFDPEIVNPVKNANNRLEAIHDGSITSIAPTVFPAGVLTGLGKVQARIPYDIPASGVYDKIYHGAGLFFPED